MPAREARIAAALYFRREARPLLGCLRLYEAGGTYALSRYRACCDKARTRRQTAVTGLGATEYVSASKGADLG